jgi:hypothetical protein
MITNVVDGYPKRFFDRQSVDALFAAGWRYWQRENAQ